MYIKTNGIVLRETQYRDSDKLMTLMTQELGKLTVKARGAKSARSKNKAACQLLAYSEFTLSEHQGRYTVTETVPLEQFAELRGDLELLALASYFAQVTDTVAQEGDPQPELLSLLLNALYALGRLRLPQRTVKAVFELRLACLAGFLPDLRGCLACGREDCDRFNVTQGALQCASCPGDGIRMPVSPAALAAMRYICSCPAKRLFAFQASDEALRQLHDIAEAYLCMRLERGFSTLDFYKSLFL